MMRAGISRESLTVGRRGIADLAARLLAAEELAEAGVATAPVSAAARMADPINFRAMASPFAKSP
jgi:hypothetical protein